VDLGYEVVTTDEMLDGGIEAFAGRILEKMRGRKVFLSFDMDVVDPRSCREFRPPRRGGPPPGRCSGCFEAFAA